MTKIVKKQHKIRLFNIDMIFHRLKILIYCKIQTHLILSLALIVDEN